VSAPVQNSIFSRSKTKQLATALGNARHNRGRGPTRVHGLVTHILGSISQAPGLPWIIDTSVAVKPLYDHQQGPF